MSDYTTIELSKTGKKNAGKYEALISIEDAEYVKQFNWNVLITKYVNYAVRMTGGRKNLKSVLLHRVILSRKLERELLPDEQVDHINHNGLDNRRENLRVATKAQNNANRNKHHNNTSGCKGVRWDEQRGKWHAQIRFNKKNIFLGRFNNLEDACKAYCDKAKELFGDYSNCL